MKAEQMMFDPISEGAAILPKRRDLSNRMAGREALVRDADSQMVHFLSPSAALIWECCDGATSLAACENRLRTAFRVPEGTDIAQDIEEALDEFDKKGLLENGNR